METKCAAIVSIFYHSAYNNLYYESQFEDYLLTQIGTKMKPTWSNSFYISCCSEEKVSINHLILNYNVEPAAELRYFDSQSSSFPELYHLLNL